MSAGLDHYYDWCKLHTISSAYPAEKIEAHRALVHEYLSEFRTEPKPEMAAALTEKLSSRPPLALKGRRSRVTNLTAKEVDSESKSEPKATRDPGPDGQMNRLLKKLDLSDEQVGLSKPILVDREQLIQSARADSSLNPKYRGVQIGKIVEESEAKIAALLTEDQKSRIPAQSPAGKKRSAN